VGKKTVKELIEQEKERKLAKQLKETEEKFRLQKQRLQRELVEKKIEMAQLQFKGSELINEISFLQSWEIDSTRHIQMINQLNQYEQNDQDLLKKIACIKAELNRLEPKFSKNKKEKRK
jgi:hypothetical protein